MDRPDKKKKRSRGKLEPELSDSDESRREGILTRTASKAATDSDEERYRDALSARKYYGRTAKLINTT